MIKWCHGAKEMTTEREMFQGTSNTQCAWVHFHTYFSICAEIPTIQLVKIININIYILTTIVDSRKQKPKWGI